jgi:ATP-dependent Clp protease ATP-binding subunit ClpA
VGHAEDEARALHHPRVGTEHLLLGIVADGQSSAARVLISAGVTVDGCRQKVAEAVGDGAGVKVDPGGSVALTDRAKRAIERADRLSLRRRDDAVGCEHVLLSVLDVEGRAGQVLRGLSVDVARLRDAVAGVLEQPDRTESDAAVDATGVHEPRCAQCGTTLGASLAHRIMTSDDGDGGHLRFVIAYCSVCGAALGATTAP